MDPRYVMNPLAWNALLFSLLLGGDTACFGRECAAAVLRQRDERAFFRNDHRASWGHFGAALAWGGDPERLRTDLVELLLFGLDQSEAGVRIDLPVPAERAVGETRDLIAPCLIPAPCKAYYGSRASDIDLHDAERRRERPIDLQAPSEDPLENPTPPRWLVVASLEMAATLEPNYNVHNNLLTEMFLDVGSPGTTERYCRRTVAAYPTLDSHSYLSRPDLPPEVLEAAVHGFEDMRGEVLVVPPALIEIGAARLWVAQDEREYVVDFLKKAIAIDPASYDARFLLGLLALNPGASDHREQCASLAPGTAR